MDAEIPFGGGTVIADGASEGFVPAGVGFAASQLGMGQALNAVNASDLKRELNDHLWVCRSAARACKTAPDSCSFESLIFKTNLDIRMLIL